MKNKQITTRYFKAFSETVPKEDFETAVKEFLELSNAIVSSEITWKFLSSPIIRVQEKKSILESVVNKYKVHKSLKKFLLILVLKGRINLLPQLVDIAVLELEKIKNIAEANIFVAQEITDKAKKIIIQSVEKIAGTKIEANFKTSASILGGFKAYVGNSVYDATLVHTFMRLKENIKADNSGGG